MVPRILRWVTIGFAFGALARLVAHNAPGSAVLLDFEPQSVRAELRVPTSELKFAFGHDLEIGAATAIERFGPQLVEYFRQHVAVRAPDGRGWNVEVLQMEVAASEQPVDLVVRMRWRPPKDAPVRRFALTYDAVSHEVMNHIVVVSARRTGNSASAEKPAEPEPLGVMRSFSRELRVDRTAQGSADASH